MAKLYALRRLVKDLHDAAVEYGARGGQPSDVQDLIVANYRTAKRRVETALTTLENSTPTAPPSPFDQRPPNV